MFQAINNFFNSKKNNKLIDQLSDKYLDEINQLENKFENLSQEEIVQKLNLILLQ